MLLHSFHRLSLLFYAASTLHLLHKIMSTVLKKRVLAEYVTRTVESPVKKLKFSILRWNSSVLDPSVFRLLDDCRNSNEALQFLLSVPPTIKVNSEDFQVFLQCLTLHFKRQCDSAVRTKILSLFQILVGHSLVDSEVAIFQIVDLLKQETSHKVIAEGLSTLLAFSRSLPRISLALRTIVDLAKFFLKDNNNFVKRLSLLIITENHNHEADLINLISHYIFSQDARVRCTALECLQKIVDSLGFDIIFYYNVSNLLHDDYETVRISSLGLICFISNKYPEYIVFSDSEIEVRLIDDTFVKVCRSIYDVSLAVKLSAMQLIGTLTSVSSSILNQTLDRKLMSNLRRKESYHEKLSKLVTSGEWAFGKKWLNDTPKGLVHNNDINIFSNGICGALIQGLEDDSKDIRCATIDAMYSLALAHPQFASRCLDFLIDMLSDEIECVRLKTIKCLTSLSSYLIVKEHQLETILTALGDSSIAVRIGLHKMLVSCHLSSKDCLQLLIECFLENLKKYPQDKDFTWYSARDLGKTHSDLSLSIIPLLFDFHPFFDIGEKNIEDPSYITLLIFLYNTAACQPTVISLFNEHTIKHYNNLRIGFPDLVPQLLLNEISESFGTPKTSCDISFIWRLSDSLSVFNSETIHFVLPQLEKIATIDPTLAGPANFSSQFLSSQALLKKILKNNLKNISKLNYNSVWNNIKSFTYMCLRLQYMFSGLNIDLISAVKQLQMLSLTLNFIYFAKAEQTPNPALLQDFIFRIKSVYQFFIDNSITPNKTCDAIFSATKASEGMVLSVIADYLKDSLAIPLVLKLPHPCVEIQMSSAQLLLPKTSSDTPLRFTASLVLNIPINATLSFIPDLPSVRIKLSYPDDQIHYFTPRESDFHLVESGLKKFCLESQIFLTSRNSWTETCFVEITLCIALQDQHFNGTQIYLDLCSPCKLYVGSKSVNPAVHKGIV